MVFQMLMMCSLKQNIKEMSGVVFLLYVYLFSNILQVGSTHWMLWNTSFPVLNFCCGFARI